MTLQSPHQLAANSTTTTSDGDAEEMKEESCAESCAFRKNGCAFVSSAASWGSGMARKWGKKCVVSPPFFFSLVWGAGDSTTLFFGLGKRLDLDVFCDDSFRS